MNVVVASTGSTIGVLFLICVVGAIVALVMMLRGEVLRFETSSTPQQVTMSAVSEVGTKRRWTTLSQGHGTVTFSYLKRPNFLITLFLLVFIITIPLAILYIVLNTKRESLSVYADTSHPGATQVQITSNGWRGKSAGRSIRGQLAVGAGAGATVRANAAPSLRVQPAIPASRPEPAALLAYCVSCGEPISEPVNFCSSCGTAV